MGTETPSEVEVVEIETNETKDEKMDVYEEEATPVRSSPGKNASTASLTPSSTEETTPRRSSPRKKLSSTPSISSMFKTPKSTPADQAKKFALAKYRVKINTLNDEMEKAVAEKDFLKAHEIKEKIKAVEEEIKKEGGEVGASPILPKSDSAATSPKVTPSPKTPKGRIVTVVKTPGSISPGSLTKKMTPKQMAIQEEKKRKMEEREKEKLERERKKEELKIEKEKERQEKERQKEIEKRVREVEKMEKEREKEKQRKEREAAKELENKRKEEERIKKLAEKEEQKLEQQKKKEEE